MTGQTAVSIKLENRPQCIWMQAGVVRKKYCGDHYDCPACSFDRIMQGVVEQNRARRQLGRIPPGKKGLIVSWKEKLNSLPVNQRPCVHYLKGRTEFKACLLNYHCGNCEFDQLFDDQYSVHAIICPVELQEVKGIRVPQGYYFHPGHTWAKIEGSDEVRVGIDDFALRLMGPLDSVFPPLFGKALAQGRPAIKAVRGDHQAELLSPVNGVVTAINNELRDKGSLANKSPFREGWVMRVKTENLREDLKTLMIHHETEDYIGAEVDRLQSFIAEGGGALAADRQSGV